MGSCVFYAKFECDYEHQAEMVFNDLYDLLLESNKAYWFWQENRFEDRKWFWSQFEDRFPLTYRVLTYDNGRFSPAIDEYSDNNNDVSGKMSWFTPGYGTHNTLSDKEIESELQDSLNFSDDKLTVLFHHEEWHLASWDFLVNYYRDVYSIKTNWTSENHFVENVFDLI